MSGLWSELAKKLAEKWFSLLVLPGAFYLALAATARTLGHAHALDVGLLTRRVTDYAKNPAVTSTGGQVLVLAALLATAAAVAFVAQSLGTLLERGVSAAEWQAWPLPGRYLARRSLTRRQRRWDSADADYRREYQQALAPDPTARPDPALRHRAARLRARISVERPERPTWSGDRIHAAAIRLDRDHHLDLAPVWPSLWLVLPDPVRDQITTARTALSRATTLAAWSVLYLALTIWWWPAAPLAAVIAATAHHRIRTTADTYATLLESATRLHATTLATQLGIDHTGPLDRQLGHTLTRHLRSSTA
ncbi:hypothetical protein ABZ894_22985 [Nocardia beijingensis]|uniref:hypothetical protein n=1 Tax=Nocardia beijingensis TaxID=95162 RepID=UPI0033F28F1B